MRLKIALTIFRKELLETLRDKRALMAMIGVPIIIYPLIFILISEVTLMQQTKVEQKDCRVALAPACPDEIRQWISAVEKIKIQDSQDAEADLKNGQLDAVVSAPSDMMDQINSGQTVAVEIRYDRTEVQSDEARTRIRNTLQERSDGFLRERLTQAGLEGKFIKPIDIQSQNIASADKTTGNFLGMIIPLFLIITIAVGAFYPAVDLTAGEKERGTFETLLSTPTSRMEIVTGKFLTVFGLSIVTGLLNMGSMVTVLMFQFSRMKEVAGNSGAEMPAMVFHITTGGIVMLFAMIVPLSFFICSVMMTIALFARSFKEAQNYVTPFYMMIMLPCMIVGMPGIELTAATAMIPVANVALLIKGILMQKMAVDLAFMVFVSTAGYALLALMCAAWIFQREEVILSQEKGMPISFNRKWLQPRATLTPGAAFTLYAIMLLVLIYGGTYFQSRDLVSGLIITEWGLLLAVTVAILLYFKVNLKTALNLRTPPFFSLLMAVVASVGTLVLSLQYNLLQNSFWPTPPIMEEISKALFDENTNPWLLVFAIAVSAAVCEEALFRGAILSGMKGKIHPVATVLLIALMFGAFHLSLYRLVPTMLLGIWITWLVYRTGSIFVGMAAHLVNNGLVVMSQTNLLPKKMLDSMEAWKIETNGFPLWLVLTSVGVILLAVIVVELEARAKNRCLTPSDGSVPGATF